mmetsp:Transcript_1231/g.2799  ORF Transcript_1231/g.2799 Transcript_1231/m.2799 type:complete len:182 (+) Transcript_1231:945-1490(+)
MLSTDTNDDIEPLRRSSSEEVIEFRRRRTLPKVLLVLSLTGFLLSAGGLLFQSALLLLMRRMVEILLAKECMFSREELLEHVGIEVRLEFLFLKPLLIKEQKELFEPNLDEDKHEFIESFLRSVETISPLPNVSCLSYKDVSTQSTVPTVFMVGLLDGFVSQQFAIKSLIAFDAIVVKSGR